jgi:hypothetical protein
MRTFAGLMPGEHRASAVGKGTVKAIASGFGNATRFSIRPSPMPSHIANSA